MWWWRGFCRSYKVSSWEGDGALKANNKSYANASNQHRRVEFEERDIILIYLKQERFPKGTYNLRSNKLGPCKALKKIKSNVYVIEIGFTNKPSLQEFWFVSNWGLWWRSSWNLRYMTRLKVIEDVLDVKEAESQRYFDGWRRAWPPINVQWSSENFLKFS